MSSTVSESTTIGNHSSGTGPLMPFGKYKGTPLEDLPNEYLIWLGCLDGLRHPLLGHVLREMGRWLAESEVQP